MMVRGERIEIAVHDACVMAINARCPCTSVDNLPYVPYVQHTEYYLSLEEYRTYVRYVVLSLLLVKVM